MAKFVIEVEGFDLDEETESRVGARLRAVAAAELAAFTPNPDDDTPHRRPRKPGGGVLVTELPDRINGGIILQIAAEHLNDVGATLGLKNLGGTP
jgi:hypothetical protein